MDGRTHRSHRPARRSCAPIQAADAPGVRAPPLAPRHRRSACGAATKRPKSAVPIPDLVEQLPGAARRGPTTPSAMVGQSRESAVIRRMHQSVDLLDGAPPPDAIGGTRRTHGPWPRRRTRPARCRCRPDEGGRVTAGHARRRNGALVLWSRSNRSRQKLHQSRRSRSQATRSRSSRGAPDGVGSDQRSVCAPSRAVYANSRRSRSRHDCATDSRTSGRRWPRRSPAGGHGHRRREPRRTGAEPRRTSPDHLGEGPGRRLAMPATVPPWRAAWRPTPRATASSSSRTSGEATPGASWVAPVDPAGRSTG